MFRTTTSIIANFPGVPDVVKSGLIIDRQIKVPSELDIMTTLMEL